MITTDRDVFVGIHVTEETKEWLRLEAQKRKMSMSALGAEILEKFMHTPREGMPDRRRSNRRGVPAVASDQKIETALSKEVDRPLPLE